MLQANFGEPSLDLDDAAIDARLAQKSVTFLAGEHVWHSPRASAAWHADAQIRKTVWEPMLRRSEVRYRNPYQCRHT